jgi:hypothetical protein
MLGGGFILVAAVIAGLTAWYNTQSLQDHENRQLQRQVLREERQSRTEVIGAARLLFAELLGAATQMTILGGDRVFRRFDPAYRIAVRQGDMRLVASHLKPEQWGMVQQAIVNAEGLETFVSTQIDRGRLVMTKSEACVVRLDVRSISLGAAALADLADASRRPQPLKPIRCKPGPGPLPRALRRRLEAAKVTIEAPPLAPGATVP